MRWLAHLRQGVMPYQHLQSYNEDAAIDKTGTVISRCPGVRPFTDK